MNRLKKWAAIVGLVAVIGGGAVVADTAFAGAASANRVSPCLIVPNGSVNIVSSGVHVCFQNSGGPENVQLPSTYSLYTGGYSNIHVNMWLCPNYTSPSCTGGYVYRYSLPGANRSYTFTSGYVDIVQISYS